jgi:hypothetical protein
MVKKVPTKYYFHVSKAYDELTIAELETLVKKHPDLSELAFALRLRKILNLH